MRTLINTNDETRRVSFRDVDCHDQPAPFHQGQYSQISLTHLKHFISDVDEGFLTFHVRLNLQLNTDLSKLQQINDPNNFNKLFVGFKSSNQLFDRLEILHNNVNVGYQQNECIREGFLYSAVKPETEKNAEDSFIACGKTSNLTHKLTLEYMLISIHSKITTNHKLNLI